MENKIAISVMEAAELIGVSKTKMYEIMKQDDADFVIALGGRRLIAREKLERWVYNQAGKYGENIPHNK